MFSIGMDFANSDILSLECFAGRAGFRFQVFAIRMDFVQDSVLSLECFAVRADFRFQVFATGMDFAEDNLLLEHFTDGADFRFLFALPTERALELYP